jgi:hypothetical protein
VIKRAHRFIKIPAVAGSGVSSAESALRQVLCDFLSLNPSPMDAQRHAIDHRNPGAALVHGKVDDIDRVCLSYLKAKSGTLGLSRTNFWFLRDLSDGWRKNLTIDSPFC